MLIDWFTVIAQAINFLILVGLLKWLLFDRIVSAMEQRRQDIAAKFEQAEREREEAEQQAGEARRQREEIEEHKRSLLAEAREEVEQQRRAWRDRAAQEVEQRKRKWFESVESQREAFVRDLHRAAARSICKTVRRALADLADAELERQVVRRFVSRLGELDDEARDRLREARERAEAPPRVWSHADLDKDDREKIGKVCRDLLGERAEPRFDRDEALVCGLRLEVDGEALGWSLDEFADAVAEQVEQQLESWREAEQAEDRDETDGKEADNAAEEGQSEEGDESHESDEAEEQAPGEEAGEVTEPSKS